MDNTVIPRKETDVLLFLWFFVLTVVFYRKTQTTTVWYSGDSSDWFMAYFFIILQGNWSALFQSRTTFKRFVSSNKWLLSKQIIDSFFPNSFLYFFFPYNVCVWQDTKDQTIFIRPLILWKILSMHVFKRAQISHFIRSDNKLYENA